MPKKPLPYCVDYESLRGGGPQMDHEVARLMRTLGDEFNLTIPYKKKNVLRAKFASQEERDAFRERAKGFERVKLLDPP